MVVRGLSCGGLRPPRSSRGLAGWWFPDWVPLGSNLRFSSGRIKEKARNGESRSGDYQSGRPDSNRGPSAPKADALPGCATPRLPDFSRTVGWPSSSDTKQSKKTGFRLADARMELRGASPSSLVSGVSRWCFPSPVPLGSNRGPSAPKADAPPASVTWLRHAPPAKTKKDTTRPSLPGSPGIPAFGTRTELPQGLERVEAGVVAVTPDELEGIFSDVVNGFGIYPLRHHG